MNVGKSHYRFMLEYNYSMDDKPRTLWPQDLGDWAMQYKW